MMETTIEWTKTRGPDGTWHPGYTFNGWSGCDKVSAGCCFCYAEALPPAMRRGAVWGPSTPRVLAPDPYWRKPEAWNEHARKLGVRLKVFAHSVSDVFEARDDLDPWRLRLFGLIERTPHLDWLLLTKRAEEVLRRVPAAWAAGAGRTITFPRNVWIGVTMEDHRAYRDRIGWLAEVPAVVRYISYEPAVGPLFAPDDPEFRLNYPGMRPGVDWLIAGGESGRNARAPSPRWFRQARDLAARDGVPFLFKQWGEWGPSYGAGLARLGKKASGRLLDGVTHDDFPVPHDGGR
jgi:protein gp37